MTPDTVVVIVAILGTLALAKELPVNMRLKAELYDTGLAHEKIMTLKNVRNNPCIKS
jgi:hypothetical protein